MRFRMLVTDIDGTLVDGRGEISRENRLAIAQLRRAGISVTLATGRSDEAARPIAEALQIDLPVVVCNGARVVDLEHERIYFEKHLPKRVARQAVRAFQDYGLSVCMHMDGRSFVSRFDRRLRERLLPAGGPYEEVGDLISFLRAYPAPGPAKVVAFGEPASCAMLYRLWSVQDPSLGLRRSDDCSLSQSEPDCLELVAAGVSKALGLRVLSSVLGIPVKAMVAVGNAGNDVEMLREAGAGVAVADATPDALEAAGWTVGACADHAVAEVARTWFPQAFQSEVGWAVPLLRQIEPAG